MVELLIKLYMAIFIASSLACTKTNELNDVRRATSGNANANAQGSQSDVLKQGSTGDQVTENDQGPLAGQSSKRGVTPVFSQNRTYGSVYGSSC